MVDCFGSRRRRSSQAVDPKLAWVCQAQTILHLCWNPIHASAYSRADQVTLPDQKLTVTARAHWELGWSRFLEHKPGKVLLQPSDRGTGTAIFVALTYIRRYEPQATVVVFPSDHFIYPEADFVETVRTAVSAAEVAKHWLILLTVPPKGAEAEYGWIKPGVPLGWINGHRLQITESFAEKPSLDYCRKAMAAGALWNTMIVAADLNLLWEQGYRHLPDLMPALDLFTAKIGTQDEKVGLENLHQELTFHDFSAEFLQRIPQQTAVLELSGVVWSDWGRPNRIVESLDFIGKAPAFRLAEVGS
jgi:mannose-1-phosphate guanylyltransferase